MAIELHGTLWDAIAEEEHDLIEEAVKTSFALLGNDVVNLDWSYFPEQQFAKAA
jgi:hypothetical protein